MKPLAIVCQICILLLLLAGCAPTFQAVTDSATPVREFGFSIMPPTGQHWYLTKDSGQKAIGFVKRNPEYTKQEVSVIVVAQRLKALKHDIRNIDGLRLEVEQMVNTHSLRHTLVSSKIESYQDKDLGTDCTRVETVSEERKERNNPSHLGKVLLMRVTGKACRLSPEDFVYVTYSERRINGSDPKPMDETLRKECEFSVNSLRFLSNQ